MKKVTVEPPKLLKNIHPSTGTFARGIKPVLNNIIIPLYDIDPPTPKLSFDDITEQVSGDYIIDIDYPPTPVVDMIDDLPPPYQERRRIDMSGNLRVLMCR